MAMNDLEQGRLRREWRTLEAMIVLYCHSQHGGRRRALCPSCSEFRDYARVRLERCPFGAEKPTCAHCTVHCYRPEPRELARAIMRWAGPKMLLRHPYLAAMHLLVDGRRPAPVLRKRTAPGDTASAP